MTDTLTRLVEKWREEAKAFPLSTTEGKANELAAALARHAGEVGELPYVWMLRKDHTAAIAAAEARGARNGLAEGAGIVRLLMLDRDTDIPKPQFATFKRAQDAILARWEELGS